MSSSLRWMGSQFDKQYQCPDNDLICQFVFRSDFCCFRNPYLDGIELLVYDLDHPLDLLGRDGPRPRLLPQQVHHVRRELGARLVVLLKLLKGQNSIMSYIDTNKLL